MNRKISVEVNFLGCNWNKYNWKNIMRVIFKNKKLRITFFKPET